MYLPLGCFYGCFSVTRPGMYTRALSVLFFLSEFKNFKTERNSVTAGDAAPDGRAFATPDAAGEVRGAAEQDGGRRAARRVHVAIGCFGRRASTASRRAGAASWPSGWSQPRPQARLRLLHDQRTTASSLHPHADTAAHAPTRTCAARLSVCLP